MADTEPQKPPPPRDPRRRRLLFDRWFDPIHLPEGLEEQMAALSARGAGGGREGRGVEAPLQPLRDLVEIGLCFLEDCQEPLRVMHEALTGGRTKDSLLADAMEAVIAAIFLDGGLPAVHRLVDPFLEEAYARAAFEALGADAVTVLSPSWSDANSDKALDSRVASSATVTSASPLLGGLFGANARVTLSSSMMGVDVSGTLNPASPTMQTYLGKIQNGFAPLMPGFLCVPANDVAAIQSATSDRDDVVAVLVEPIQGEGGIRTLDADYLQQLRALCDAQEWLLMLDEVQSGIGRTGQWFAHLRSKQFD